MDQQFAKWLILIGAFFVIAGLIFYFFQDKLQWIGRLPGDINISGENYRIFIPITTMLLFSILISVVLYLIRRFF